MRYVTRPRAYVSAHEVPEHLPTITVYEPERGPVDTGLLDAHGDRLFRMPDVWPVGFVVTAKQKG